MSRYIRPAITGARIFFTVYLEERGSTLLTDQIGKFREAVRLTKAERPFGIDAWVVLPDHMHCIWQMPVGDKDYSTRWRLIKARFSREFDPRAQRWSHRLRSERAIWQRRFWEHHIRDETDYQTHLEYCWQNPVKHELVDRAEDWPFSSVHWDRRFAA